MCSKVIITAFYKYVNFDSFLFVESFVDKSYYIEKKLSGAMKSSIDRAVGHA